MELPLEVPLDMDWTPNLPWADVGGGLMSSLLFSSQSLPKPPRT